ncbi:MAG: metallophosphoesterase family protein [Pseudomonadota bacterium]
MTQPIYAIGDIHGYSDQFDLAIDLIGMDGGQDALVVFLGDYVDRGPDSRGVIDRLVDGMAQGRNWITLKGNHDRMFQWFMESPPRHDAHLLVGYHWFHEALGGIATLQSYDIAVVDRMRLKDLRSQAAETVPQSHVSFLNALPLTYETESLFFAHAGIRPGVPLHAQDEEDLVWIRTEFHDYARPHPKLIVHGHTPVERATHYGNRVNLDSGAGYGRPVTVAVFEGDRAWYLTRGGRVPLEPLRRRR